MVRDEGLESHPLFGGGKTNDAAKEGLVAGFWKELKNWAKGFMPATPTPSTPDPVPLSTRLAGSYLLMLEVRPVVSTSLVVIKFTTPDPALSARLANAHASSYVRYGIDLRSQTNSEASEFLQEKLTELKERVQQSEAALNSYRKEKGIISVDDKSNVIIERLLDLNKGLTAAEGDRIAWEAQVRAARGRNADEVPSVRNSAVIGSLKAELGKFEAEYASLAKEFKAGYPPLDNVKTRLEETRRHLNSEIDKEVKGIEAGFAAARNKESELRVAMEDQKKATLNLKDSAVQYAILAREVDTNKQLYDGVLQRLKEIGVAAEVRTSNIYVMGKALPPGSPSYPDKRRSMLLGLLLGLAAGIGLAFFLEQLDNTLKSPEEAERYLRLPSLAMVPDFVSVNGTTASYVSRLLKSAQAELPVSARKAAKAKHADSSVLLDHHSLSVVAEAYRSFRSALLLSQAGGPPHTILVTSAARGEGKTTTLVNSAIVFAQLGIRVLIIDADLRRPRCHALLRMENLAGLSDLLAGQIELQSAIRPTSAENLSFISAGALPPNPAELLGSKKMHDLLEQLRDQFEFIFVDSSPLLAVSDAVFLSTMVDGTLLVVNRRTPKPLLRKARARLTTTHGKILGMLLNRINIHNNEYGGYYQQYYEYYSQDPPAITDNAPALSENGHGRLSRRSRLNGTFPVTLKPVASEKSSNGVSTGALDVVRAKLGEAMGPMASLVLRDSIRALGESSESFPEAKLEVLVQHVSQEILDDYQRQRFEEETLKEIKKTTEQHGAAQPDGPVKADSAISKKKPNGTAVDNPSLTSEPAAIQEPRDGADGATASGAASISEKTSEALPHRRGKNPAAIPKPATKKTMNKESREELSPEFLKLVIVRLTQAMGPIAPLVLLEHISAIGETPESFPPARLEELVQRLCKEVVTDSFRQQFEEEMAKLTSDV